MQPNKPYSKGGDASSSITGNFPVEGAVAEQPAYLKIVDSKAVETVAEAAEIIRQMELLAGNVTLPAGSAAGAAPSAPLAELKKLKEALEAALKQPKTMETAQQLTKLTEQLVDHTTLAKGSAASVQSGGQFDQAGKYSPP